MKKKTFLISIILISSFLSFAQLNWEKHENNPVMQVQPGTWYSWNVFFPVVIYENDIYKMWFCGNNHTPGRHIGYAESLDGIDWDIWDDPVISSGEPGPWAIHIYPGSVLRINDTLRMWFCGSTNSSDNGSIGYAWSVEEHIWNTHPEPIMESGVSGAWDDMLVFHPWVYHDGTGYHMYYMGADFSTETWELGYASSTNGIDWGKYEDNPVLPVGPEGSFYDAGIINGCPIMYNDTIRLFFTGFDGTTSYPPYYSFMRIGYAWSLDYLNWNIEPEPVVDVGTTGAWDESIVAGQSVLIHDGHFHLWYWGDHYNANWEIGYACGDEAIIRVPSEQPTIQAGIDAACSGATVLVAPGTYYENINFKGKAITVASQFLMDGDTNHISNTIIDGSQSLNPDSASVVYFISGEDTTSTICGFTIQNGSGTYPDQWATRSGGGIYCTNSGPKIIHNIITDNHVSFSAGAGGGGIMVASSGGNLETVVIRHNTISGNSVTNSSWNIDAAGGGLLLWMTNVVMQFNIITNNTASGWAYGGGLSLGQSTGIISHNHFESNNANITYPNGMGGGIFINIPKSGLNITQNTIISNNCTGGTNRGGGIGVINWGSDGDYYIDRNIIAENVANRGGAICLSVSEPGCFITNNIIRDNSASEDGGGICMYISSAKNLKFGLGQRGSNHLNLRDPIKDGLIPKIINNTILYNEAFTWGGGIANGLSGTDILAFNNIFYGNDAVDGADVSTQFNTSTTHLYNNDIDTNLIFGYWSGENNIFVDPEFKEDGYHLLETSQCIEAGISSVEIDEAIYNSPEFDIDGDLRPFNLMVDIGADEFYPQTWIQESEIISENQLLQNFPNPFSGSTSISFELESDAYTELCIYDLTGKKIQTILSQHLQSGKYNFELDATRLLSGIYFYQLKTENKIAGTCKMIVLK